MTRRAGYNMIEMLVVLCLVAIVISSTTSLIVGGLRGLSLSEKRVQMNQLIPAWQTAWQSALRGTDPTSWRMEGTTLIADPVRIALEDKVLHIQSGDRTRRIPLPGIVDPTLAIERHPDRADCAVLKLYWESRFLSGVTTNQVRFVACGGGAS